MHRASGPVTVGLFCHSFLVKLTSASCTVSCCNSPVTSETQKDSASIYLDCIRVTLRATVSYSLIFLWFWCAMLPDPHSPIDLIILLHLTRGWASLMTWLQSLLIPWKYDLGIPSRGLDVTSLLFCLGDCPQKAEAPFIFKEFPGIVVPPLNSRTLAAREEVSFPSHLLMSFHVHAHKTTGYLMECTFSPHQGSAYSW